MFENSVIHHYGCLCGRKTHSEFKGEYHFICKKPEKLAYVDVMLFNVFSGIEKIEIQLFTVTKKTALELTAKKRKIFFYSKFKSY